MRNERKLSRWKYAIFAITPLVVLIVAGEIVLRVVGFSFNPHDLNRPIFESTADGYLKTSEFYTHNERFVPATFCVPQSIPKKKPADTIRVALLGGSSTYLLGTADSLIQQIGDETGKTIEILNFGILGCGSDRVVVSAEAAIEFDADVLVVYCGHNEFTSFSDSGSYSNVPFGMRPFVRHSRTVQLIWKAVDSTRTQEKAELHPGTKNFFEGQRTFDSPAKEERYLRFADNLRQLSKLCAEHNRGVIFCTVSYNALMPPYFNDSNSSLEELQTLSVETLSRLVELNPNDLLALHQYGVRLYEAGETEKGRELIEQAFIESPRPDRANQRINEIIATVAKEEQIPLVDAQSTIRVASECGLPGDDLFRDNCHLNDRGNQLLLDEISRHLGHVVGDM